MTNNQDKNLDSTSQDTSGDPTGNFEENGAALPQNKSENIENADVVGLPKVQTDTESSDVLLDCGVGTIKVDEDVVSVDAAVASAEDEGDVETAKDVEQVIENNLLLEDGLRKNGEALEARTVSDAGTVDPTAMNNEGQTDSSEADVVATEDKRDIETAKDVEQVIENNSLREEKLREDGGALEESAVLDAGSAESTDVSSEGLTDSNDESAVDHSDVDESEANSNQLSNDDGCIAAILDRCILEDSSEIAKEREQLDIALGEASIWIGYQRNLQSALNRLKDSFSKILNTLEKFDDALPQNIREELTSRKEGIQLCGRMLDRAQMRICNGNPKEEEEEDEVAALSELHVEVLPSELLASSPEDIEGRVSEFFKSRRINHNMKILDARNKARSAEKIFLSGIERQVLPIIDGLDEGKKIGITTIDSLVEQFPETQEKLKKWFQVYDVLIKKFESELKELGLQPRIATPGEPVDYELYDPVDVEEDPQFEDEQIKEIMRRGYVLVGAPGGIERVVRPGQVVVVKNPPKE